MPVYLKRGVNSKLFFKCFCSKTILLKKNKNNFIKKQNKTQTPPSPITTKNTISKGEEIFLIAKEMLYETFCGL